MKRNQFKTGISVSVLHNWNEARAHGALHGYGIDIWNHFLEACDKSIHDCILAWSIIGNEQSIAIVLGHIICILLTNSSAIKLLLGNDMKILHLRTAWFLEVVKMCFYHYHLTSVWHLCGCWELDEWQELSSTKQEAKAWLKTHGVNW